ncbi:MAG: dimethylsulfonioproprionate lyase family protein [Pseudomonadota bacterium]
MESVRHLGTAMLDYLAMRPQAEKFLAPLRETFLMGTPKAVPHDDQATRIACQYTMGAGSVRSDPLVRMVQAALPDLSWGTAYDGDPAAGDGFAERAAATFVFGGKGPFGARDVMAGIFVVGPRVRYFDHAHGPEELYLPIAGRARYWSASKGWRMAGPDDVIVHEPWEWHAMETQDEPVLILWSWLGANTIDVWPDLRPSFGDQPLH